MDRLEIRHLYETGYLKARGVIELILADHPHPWEPELIERLCQDLALGSTGRNSRLTKTWSDHEIALLMEAIGPPPRYQSPDIATVRALAQKLERSEHSIKGRIERIRRDENHLNRPFIKTTTNTTTNQETDQ